MAFDIFATFGNNSVQMPAMPKSTEKRSAGIPIISLAFGTENETNITSASSGAGAGKAKFKPIVITKHIDATSPTLFAVLCRGGHYETVTFDFFQAGGEGANTKPYYSIACKMVAIRDFEQSGSVGDDVPLEQITFQCGAIQLNYRPQDTKGALGDPVSTQWSTVLNKAAFEVK